MPLTRFDLVIRKDPQALIRALNYFAQIGLSPRRVRSVEAEATLSVRIEQPDLPDHQARIIAEKMRSSFLVDAVHVHRGRRLLTPLSEATHDLSA